MTPCHVKPAESSERRMVSGEVRSLLGMRGAERGSRNQKLAFGGLDWLQLYIAIVLTSFIDLGAQIIDFSRFCFESHGRTDALGRFLKGARLPVGADLMLPSVHRKEKIGLALVGADPCAIEPYPHGRAVLHVLEDVNQGFARIRGCDGMLLAVRLYVKQGFARTAATSGRNRGGLTLRKARRRETRQENACEKGLVHDHWTRLGAGWFPDMPCRYLSKAASGGELGVPAARGLDGALLRAEVDVGDAKALGGSFSPLRILPEPPLL